MTKTLIDQLNRVIDHLATATRESEPTPDHPAGRPVVAYAHRREALRILGGVHKQLSSDLEAASEAVESHLLSQGVRKLSLEEPAVTLYIERRPFVSVVKVEGEDTNTAHSRAAEALRAAGLAEFAHTRINLQGLTSHYRELLEAEGDEAVNARLAEELGGSVQMTVTSRVKTRKAG